jgi:hypothetical protein
LQNAIEAWGAALMDRHVNVRFFSVENADGAEASFGDCLLGIARRSIANRESEVSDGIIIRLERLRETSNILAGQFVRIQSENLPPRAVPGQPIASLGVPSIGHTSAFRYDRQRSVLALQLGQNGITAPRLSLYLQDLVDVAGFNILPILTQDAWQKLTDGRVRKMIIRIARPERLQATVQDHRSVKAGFETMQRVAHTEYVEMILGMGHSEHDIPKGRARAIFEWLLRERQDNQADIRKVAAEIRDDARGENEMLTFLDAHMGERTTLGLPRDNPERAYVLTDQFIQRAFQSRRAELNAQF